MFGKKSAKKKTPEPVTEEAASKQPEAGPWAGRVHAEELGHVWAALTGMDPRALIPQVVGTIISEGGTRPPWQWQKGNREFMLVAWPQDQPIRACVLMTGERGGQLKPATVAPLLEGFPNDLTVAETHPRSEGQCGDVGVEMLDGKNPMWFFDPLFERDLTDLTPGVMHTFWLAGAALSIRKALLDEISLTSGPQFEAWAAQWLKEHPEREKRETPPLKIDIRGKSIIMPGRVFGEYQIRAKIDKVEDWQLEKMPIKALYLSFPFDDRPSLRLPLYVSKAVLGDYEPEAGEEIEAYVWLQGRIIDLERANPSDVSNAKE